MTIAWIAPILRPRRESPDRRARRQAHRRRFALEQFEDRTLLSTWIGGAAGNWNDAANWSDNKLPSGTEPAIIGDGATVTVDIATASARSLTLKDGATLNLNGNTLRANATGNAVANGLVMSANASLIGGDGGALVVGGNFTIDAGGSFNVGDVTFTGVITGTVNSNVAFNNVTITYGSHHFKVAPDTTLDVNGDLTINSNNSITGTILASKNVTSNAAWGGNSSRYGHLILDGSGPQTLKGDNGGKLPNVVNAKTNGSTLKLIGGISPENWTQTSGKLDAAGSTTNFRGGYTNVDTGNTSLGDVTVDMGNNHFRVAPGTGKLAIGGNLLISDAQSIIAALGAITVAGNLTSTDTTVGGSADITMLGGATSTITAAPGDFPNGGIVIKKGSASLNANMTTPLDGPLTIESVWAINKGAASAGLTGELVVGNHVTTKTGVGGNATIVFAGGGAQTLTTTKDGAGVVGVKIAQASGGSFKLDTTASANTLRVNGSWIVAANNAGAINLAGSAIRFTAASGESITVATGSSGLKFNDVEVAIGSFDLNAVNMIVDGKLTLTKVYSISGVITANGNVTTAANAIHSGGGAIHFTGTGDQRLSASSPNGGVPAVVVNKPSGTLTLASGNTINANGNWTWTKGAVDATGSTIRLTNANNVNTGPGNGGMKFNNFEIAIGSNTLKIENKLGVLGDLTIASAWAINAAPGAITVGGNLTSTSKLDAGGSANITMVGSNDASITAVPITNDKNVLIPSNFPNGGVIINKSGATITANVTTPLNGPLSLQQIKALTGTFQVAGNVATNMITIGGNADGAPVLIFKGNKAQTIDTGNTSNKMIPGIEIDKSGGSLAINNDLKVGGSWIVASTNQAPVNIAAGATTSFHEAGETARTIDIGNTAGFQNVVMRPTNGSDVTILGNVPVAGDLSFVNRNYTLTGGGSLLVSGNVDTSITNAGNLNGSNVAIAFVGDGAQKLTANSNGAMVPSIVINKSGDGKLTIGGSNTNMFRVMGDWKYIAGDVDASSSKIQFMKTNGNTTIRPGTMKFGDVIVSIGSNKMDIVDANDCAVDALYTGTYTKSSGTINKGRFVKYTP